MNKRLPSYRGKHLLLRLLELMYREGYPSVPLNILTEAYELFVEPVKAVDRPSSRVERYAEELQNDMFVSISNSPTGEGIVTIKQLGLMQAPGYGLDTELAARWENEVQSHLKKQMA